MGLFFNLMVIHFLNMKLFVFIHIEVLLFKGICNFTHESFVCISIDKLRVFYN